MRFIYQEHSLKPGIYKILNTHNNRIYVGQAKEFKERWRSHSYSLLANKHQNKFLLNDFNKCKEELGHDDFLEFHVLEVMDSSTKQERNAKEEEWIAKHYDEQNLCYNFKQKVESLERTCRSLVPEETRQKVSDGLKLAWANKSEKERSAIGDKISKANKGKKASPERVEKNRMSHIGQPAWNKGLKMPDQSDENHHMFGKQHTEESIAKMSNALKGKVPWNKGIVKPKEPKTPKFRGKIYDNIQLLSPDGTVYTRIEGLWDFAEAHELNPKLLWKLLKKLTTSTRGWKLLG